MTLALRLLVAGFLMTFLCGVQGFKWDCLPEDGAILYSCPGRKVSISWSFTAGREEELHDIHWTFDGLFTTQLIGSFTHDQFLPNPQYSERLRHLDYGGLSLSDVTVSDTGNYTVEANMRNALGVIVSYSRQVFLQVGEGLQAKQEPVALWDSERGQWVIRLTCGTFTFAGQPPIDVSWTTPTGETKPSDDYNNGLFHLTLTSPVVGGNYSCHIPKDHPSDLCRTDIHLVKASVQVVEVLARLSLIEAEHRTLKEEKKQLKEENEKLKEELQNVTKIQQEDVAYLKQYVKEEKNEVMQDIRRLEDVHLTHNTNLTDSIKLLEQRVSNMETPVVKDCAALKAIINYSRIYTITVKQGVTVNVYCDQYTDGGGWTVVQKRVDGRVDFNRNWTEYEAGFGDPSGEYWIGLANLHHLTSSGQYSLRVDLQDFDGDTAYAVYDHFSVSGPDDKYRLSVSGYRGTAGNSLMQSGTSTANKQRFSTSDSDNDGGGNHCAQYYKSGWWFNDCMTANLNGEYKAGGGRHNWQGVVWEHWHDDVRSYKRAEMKVRPRQS